ncbi:hypothetical protein G6O67_003238 [Ophiocordyceps sinensis]|uniref:Uncharacterized protein n=1 Tax=Ophiocordyceps sinensis TaxID=72228 RepID=A0A8H4PWD2_9HYPO|nr:hypothetical protein G6O67_003238 [Ophiocordyceps sinensis]
MPGQTSSEPGTAEARQPEQAKGAGLRMRVGDRDPGQDNAAFDRRKHDAARPREATTDRSQYVARRVSTPGIIFAPFLFFRLCRYDGFVGPLSASFASCRPCRHVGLVGLFVPASSPSFLLPFLGFVTSPCPLVSASSPRWLYRHVSIGSLFSASLRRHDGFVTLFPGSGFVASP